MVNSHIHMHNIRSLTANRCLSSLTGNRCLSSLTGNRCLSSLMPKIIRLDMDQRPTLTWVSISKAPIRTIPMDNSLVTNLSCSLAPSLVSNQRHNLLVSR
jgi:hypothetical protein